MKDHLRFAVVLLAHLPRHGRRPVRPRLRRPPVGGRHRLRRHGRSSASTSRSSSWRSSASRTTASTTATSPPKARTSRETNKNLDAVVKALKEEQQRTGIKLLWGTANLFSNPRFVHGASTSCNADVFAYAAAQVKKALEVTKELGGENYVFWGGREGYMNLYNTDLKRELDHLAKFFHLAVDYKKKIGFTGQFLIEPKPKEPTTHQYDFDAADCIAFLRGYGLDEGLQAQRRDEPRDARRAHDDARADVRVSMQRHARLRSTPTAATCCSAGTPTSSRPTCT